MKKPATSAASKALIPAVGYLRMSTDRQETSIPDQKKAIIEYAAKHGYQIIAWYVDEGISGDNTDKRTDFKRMIADAKGGTFRAILVWDQDRFGRFDSIEAGHWIYPLRQANVQLVTLNDGAIDWDGFSGRLIYNVKQEGKYQFLVDLSRNVTRGLLNSALAGRWVTGKPPYGYALDENLRLVLSDPLTVERVRWLFNRYLEPGSSLTGLAETLNRRGDPGPKGGIWRVQTIQTILRNPNYTGDFVWNRRHCGKYHGIADGEIRSHQDVTAACREPKAEWAHLNRASDHVVIKDSHPAIVTRKTFERVQAKLSERQLCTTPHRGGGTFVLSDLLRCGHCGAKLYGADRKSTRNGREYVYRRYVCASYVQSGHSVCRHHAVLEDPLKELLIRTLQERVLDPKRFERLRAEVRRQLKERRSTAGTLPADAIRNQVAQLDRQLDTAADRLLKVPEKLLDTVVAKMEQLRVERDRLQAQVNATAAKGRVKVDRLDDAVDRAMQRATRLSEALEGGSPAAIRDVFHQTVERVDCWFTTEVRGKRTFYPFSRGLIRLRSPQIVTGLVQHATRRRCVTG